VSGAALAEAAGKYHPWINSDIQLVLGGSDLPIAELAEKLDRSPNTIRAMRSRLGNAPP
jgi:hypothetical protein